MPCGLLVDYNKISDKNKKSPHWPFNGSYPDELDIADEISDAIADEIYKEMADKISKEMAHETRQHRIKGLEHF